MIYFWISLGLYVTTVIFSVLSLIFKKPWLVLAMGLASVGFTGTLFYWLWSFYQTFGESFMYLYSLVGQIIMAIQHGGAGS